MKNFNLVYKFFCKKRCGGSSGIVGDLSANRSNGNGIQFNTNAANSRVVPK